MNYYAEILEKALTQYTLENLFKNFLDTVEPYSRLNCISEEQLNEIIEVINKSSSEFYSADKDDEKTLIITTKYDNYWYSDKEIKTTQNLSCWLERWDYKDFQILIGSYDEDINDKIWLLPIFFREFYIFYEEINNTTKKEKEETSTDKKEICNILATKIAKNFDSISAILKELEKLKESEKTNNDITVNFLTNLFNAYLSD